jgi:hypothetical protein
MSRSFKPKSNEIKEPRATSIQPKTRAVSVGNSTREGEIRRRAYKIYLERGGQPGGELDDWLQAERELKDGLRSRAQAG